LQHIVSIDSIIGSCSSFFTSTSRILFVIIGALLVGGWNYHLNIKIITIKFN
jgi:hypothetical protein